MRTLTNEQKQRIVYALAISGPSVMFCGIALGLLLDCAFRGIFDGIVGGVFIAVVELLWLVLPISAMYLDLWWRYSPALDTERSYGKSVLSCITPSFCGIFAFGWGLVLSNFKVLIFSEGVLFSAPSIYLISGIPGVTALVATLAYPIVAWRLTVRAKSKTSIERTPVSADDKARLN